MGGEASKKSVFPPLDRPLIIIRIMLKVTRAAIVLFHTSTVVSRLSSMYLVTKIQFIIVAMRGGGKSTSFPGFSPTRPSWERGWRESQILRVELSS